MSKRDRRRPRKQKRRPVGNPVGNPAGNRAGNPSAPVPGDAAAASRTRLRWGWLLSASAAVLLAFVAYRLWTAPRAVDAPVRVAKNVSRRDFNQGEPTVPEDVHGHPPATKETLKETPKRTSDSFLDDFNQEKADPEKVDADKGGGPASADGELEKQFQELVQLNDQIKGLERRASSPGSSTEEHDRLVHLFDRKSAALEKDVKQAVQARPDAAVPRWLTGELLILVGGEPEESLPHLQFALDHGLSRPHLFASLSRDYLESNRFADAYRYALQAVEKGGSAPDGWDAFMFAAVSTNHFDQVVDRLDRTFPAGLPGWAQAYRRDAAALQSQWAAEQKVRKDEARADDLPRVRLVIEHRRFAKDPAGQPLTTIESTGREEAILELFENEAPNTVANFLSLAERKFYDGTRFHLAVPSLMVAGGDPNSKNEDPSGDGAGGPGYMIPDECTSPKARNSFHGTLSMVNTGPGTAGSQFFFTLLPRNGMNGHFTVFGRVLQGQDVIDHITRGRTTREIPAFGKIIPGDLLVRAEVIRKRPHEYRVIKEQR